MFVSLMKSWVVHWFLSLHMWCMSPNLYPVDPFLYSCGLHALLSLCMPWIQILLAVETFWLEHQLYSWQSWPFVFLLELLLGSTYFSHFLLSWCIYLCINKYKYLILSQHICIRSMSKDLTSIKSCNPCNNPSRLGLRHVSKVPL
jgi:hypothetical protein